MGLEGYRGNRKRTLLALVVLKSLHTGERGGTGENLVGEVALVLVLVVVHLTVSVVGFACVALLASFKVGCGRGEHTPAPSHCVGYL